MREAKYRGFSEDTRKWHFGHGHFLIKHTKESGLEDYSVLHTDGSPAYVVPESIGEYTGLKDKNGVEIYEGDVIFVPAWNRKYKIVFEAGMFRARNLSHGWNENKVSLATFKGEINCKVIGNIHEHPHLLEASS